MTTQKNRSADHYGNSLDMYLLILASGDLGDLISSVLAFSSESKLPFSASVCLPSSSLSTLLVNSSASTIPFVCCWFKWHSMVFWLIALFVNAGRLISHISARGSMFILETMILSSSVLEYKFNSRRSTSSSSSYYSAFVQFDSNTQALQGRYSSSSRS